MEFIHILASIPWGLYALALFLAFVWRCIPFFWEDQLGGEWVLIHMASWGVYMVGLVIAFTSSPVFPIQAMPLPVIAWIFLFVIQHLGSFIVDSVLDAFRAQRESDVYKLNQAKRLACELKKMLPPVGWERERELIAEVVDTRLPELFWQRNELRANAERLEEFVAREREANGPKFSELRARCTETARKQRERIEAVNADITECLAFLVRAEGELRLTMMSTESVGRTHVSALFDEFVSSARATSERHVAAQREVESELAAARGQVVQRIPAR